MKKKQQSPETSNKKEDVLMSSDTNKQHVKDINRRQFLNAVGTNFMNYPGFRDAAGAKDPKVFQKI